MNTVLIYKRYRFPASIISHCVWMYYYLSLSFRAIELMNNLCDLYLPEPIISSEFKHLRIFDKNFVYEEGVQYSGYIGISIKRIHMLSVIV